MRREFLMLAHTYNPSKHNIKGWLASEKLDGIRCLWDGGISRGLQKSSIPWANTDKDERYLSTQYATGLWSRYGNILHAPNWWLDQLPEHPLDGELFSDRRSWQELSTIVKKIQPNIMAWQKVTFNVFDVPPYQILFQPGTVNTPNYKKEFDPEELFAFARPRIKMSPRFMDFATVTDQLQKISNTVVRPVQQTVVNGNISELLSEVLSLDGEGLIVRNPKSYWEPKRSHCQVKIKPSHDDEATVIGYVWGRETDKGSKLLGLMGALVTSYRGKRFELSGFTDAEREMTCLDPLASNEGFMYPGEEVSDRWINLNFPRGSKVSFKYRELSDGGLPKEAAFWRKHLGA